MTIILSVCLILVVTTKVIQGSNPNDTISDTISAVSHQKIPSSQVVHGISITPESETDKLMQSFYTPACFVNHTVEAEFTRPGQHFHEMLSDGFIKDLEVISGYSLESRKVPVNIISSWYNTSNLNVTQFFTALNAPSIEQMILETTGNLSLTCDDKTKANIDMIFCTRDSFYQEILDARPTVSGAFCQIPIEKQADYYMQLWSKNSPSNFILSKVCLDPLPINITYKEWKEGYKDHHPEAFGCSQKGNSVPKLQRCRDPQYKINFFNHGGRGTISKISAKASGSQLDLNMTFDFTEWTKDYPEQLLSLYNNCQFDISKTKLKINYMIKDPDPTFPPKSPPLEFWIYALLIAIPVVVVLFALLLVICTRSMSSLVDPRIWDYFDSSKAADKEVSKII